MIHEKEKKKTVKVPKFMRTRNGCEIVSNGNDIKIVLSRSLSFIGGIERDYYITTYYIKDDEGGWVKTTTSKNYGNFDDFINDVSVADEFSEAVADYNNIK